MGTVGYMSPEQAQGLPVDHRSDIFSFGCILYEAATGARPFSGSSAIDTLHKIIHVQPAPIVQLAPTTPTELQRIVRKCLAKSPDERYQSMKDLALDLRDLRRELDPARRRRSPRRTRPARRVVTPLASLIAGLAAVCWSPSRRPRGCWRPRGDRRPRRRATFEQITSSGNVIDAIISPDGTYVAYVESAGGQQTLWVRQTRSGQAAAAGRTKGGFWGVAFSTDATSDLLRGQESRPSRPAHCSSSRRWAGRRDAILSGIDSAVTFSPDGTRVAYYRVEPNGDGASSLMVAGLDGGGARARW